ncbi:MAG: UMP kinase [Gammaproteobacteria bacterium]|nr:UMP kinase [Gammaproteobacteria bacterium]MDH3536146.1 UMP kinase [Gammaproteobacteria bacterium]
MAQIKYQRILVKLSGEALMGGQDSGIDPAMIDKLAAELIELRDAGVEIGIVVGGGNLFRGADLAAVGLDRVVGDQMGMLATVMNALALQDSLLRQGANAVVMSGLDMPQVCESYTQRGARQRIAAGEIIIFAAGTGSPYFTTDTGASLRAVEIRADLLIKATKVDGIYDKDPLKHADAVRFASLRYQQAIEQRLAVMDVAAMILCNDNGLDLVVCDINQPGALLGLARGETIGTRVTRNEAQQ